MVFRKKRPPEPEPEEPAAPPVAAEVMEILDRLEKGGGQLTVHTADGGSYTSAVIGLGRDAFYLDTLSPPEGDLRVAGGGRLSVETLFQGIQYRFDAFVTGKVRFVDELPAFKVEYPDRIEAERRRKSPRVAIQGDASLSFLQPFSCDAPVVNLSEGGLAFELAAELGRLRRGTMLRDVLLELGGHPVFAVQGRVVGQTVSELGGLGLPRRYRVSLAFQGLAAPGRDLIRTYLAELQAEEKGRGFTV